MTQRRSKASLGIPSPQLGSRSPRGSHDNPLRSVLQRSNSTNSIFISVEEKVRERGVDNDNMAVQRSPCGKFVPVASWGRVVGYRNDKEFARMALYRTTYYIGRDVHNDIVVPSPFFSRDHFTIERANNGEIAVRVLSSNGMLLNGCGIPPQGHSLKPGDTLSFREYSFRLLAPKVSKRSLNVVASIEISTKQPVAQPAQPAQVAGHAAPSPSLTVRLMQSPLAPQSAKLLSSLVASPKRISTTLARSTELPRVPLAVLQSSSVDKHTEDDKDDQGVSGPSSPSTGRLASRAMPSTPSGQKRELPEDFAATEGTPSSKKVWFGPTLSPEVFSKDEPPSTPVKRGAQTRAGTPRRAPTSTANLLERLKTASPAKSSLVSPRSLGRTVNFGELLQKPQPLKLLECNQGSTTDQPQHGRSQPSSSSHAHTEGNRSKIMTTQDNPFASSSPAPKPAQDKV